MRHPAESCPIRVLLTALALCAALCGAAAAAPQLRVQAEQRGDFLIFGNTVGFDCRTTDPVPNPLVGAVDRTSCGKGVGQVALHTNDTAIDVFWRSDEPAPGQVALTARPQDARSTAVLTLPPGAAITYARIYWSAGLPAGSPAGKTLLIERAGVFRQPVSADVSLTAPTGQNGPGLVYQSSADVTRLLQRHGAGAYRVGGIDSVPLEDQDYEVTQMVWSVVVFYRRDADPPRNLAIFDGLERVASDSPASAVLSGFVVPRMDFDAKLGLIAYEGDAVGPGSTGDFIQVNSRKLSNALNPEDNFFNATRTVLGAAVTTAGDLPQMSGAPGSMNGYDIDVVDMKDLIQAGETSASLSAQTMNDIYFLGAFITSVATYKPIFTDTRLSVVDLTAPGRFLPGDDLEFTLETRNSGNDAGVGAHVEIQLPPGVSYTPGSIQIVSGQGAGAQSDTIGDDRCEFFPGTRTVRCRLGAGADGKNGGRVAPGDAPTVIQFRGRIDEGAKGKLVTQAVVTAGGETGLPLGVPPYRFFSSNATDGNVPTDGAPTVIIIGECAADAECQGRPRGSICTADQVCGCRTSADCPAPAACLELTGQCVLPPADIRVQVAAAPMGPTGLQPVAYTIEVQNAGPGTAEDVRVVVTLPPDGTLRDMPTGAGWDCRVEETPEKKIVTCTRKERLPPGAAPPILLVADPGPTPGGVITFEAAGSGGGGPAGIDAIFIADPDASNNIVVRDFDGSGLFRAAGGGFGSCAVGPRGAGGGAAVTAALLLAILGLLRRRKR